MLCFVCQDFLISCSNNCRKILWTLRVRRMAKTGRMERMERMERTERVLWVTQCCRLQQPSVQRLMKSPLMSGTKPTRFTYLCVYVKSFLFTWCSVVNAVIEVYKTFFCFCAQRTAARGIMFLCCPSSSNPSCSHDILRSIWQVVTKLTEWSQVK